jgi:hypothetical protein
MLRNGVPMRLPVGRLSTSSGLIPCIRSRVLRRCVKSSPTSGEENSRGASIQCWLVDLCEATPSRKDVDALLPCIYTSYISLALEIGFDAGLISLVLLLGNGNNIAVSSRTHPSLYVPVRPRIRSAAELHTYQPSQYKLNIRQSGMKLISLFQKWCFFAR